MSTLNFEFNGYFEHTVGSGYKGMLNRGNSGYRGQFAADQNFYLIKTGWIEEKQSFLVDLKTSK